ncbi:MAG: DUF368 domain-containing protein [Clostridium sp.]|nr:DUF368 domain-containing protein [Clostridium sp.]MCM1209065.1 DUF368 domain-containing protein [Ruminococcus sp.]
MNFFIDLIKGIFVGVANVIPGVSGGTMAVSFGIYDKLLSSISNLFKSFKKSVKTLLPIAIGMAVGIIGFTFIIPVILKSQPFITAAAFTGLIFGGIPMIVKALKSGCDNDAHKSIAINVILFIVFTALAVALPFLGGDSESGILLTADFITIIKMLFLGVIASATMIIPGVSGSLVLMILGYYFGVINAVKDFITALKNLDLSGMIDRALLLAPFAIGCLVGIFFISKLIKWLFEHFCSATYSAILGLILSSPVSIFCKVQEEYNMQKTSVVQIVIGVILFIACTIFTLYLGKLEPKKEETV